MKKLLLTILVAISSFYFITSYANNFFHTSSPIASFDWAVAVRADKSIDTTKNTEIGGYGIAYIGNSLYAKQYFETVLDRHFFNGMYYNAKIIKEVHVTSVKVAMTKVISPAGKEYTLKNCSVSQSFPNYTITQPQVVTLLISKVPGGYTCHIIHGR